VQLGWPPPLAESVAAQPETQNLPDDSSMCGPFARALDAALAEVQRLMLGMVTLQHAADAESFAAVRMTSRSQAGRRDLAHRC
jgi:hypothetical protein